MVLLRFQAANHRSIDRPVELSMIAVDEDRPGTRSFELLHEQVLTVAGIYGANASGKSNVLGALAWLSSAVAWSVRQWDDAIPREPFRFADGDQRPSSYEVEMMVQGTRYAYQVELDGERVLFEGLYSYPKRQRRSLFEREGPDISFRRGLGSLSGTRELLTPTTLALSAAMRFDEPEVRPFGRALVGIGVLGLRRTAAGMTSVALGSTEQVFLSQADADEKRSALALLRYADLGIHDVDVVEETVLQPNGDLRTRHGIQLVHQVSGQATPFSLGDESAGTQTWFGLIGPVLETLQAGRTLLFDEIDASLHPKLSVRLLELFQDPRTNPRGAQLVFTTHDTSLLNHLNRDEVWLTEKGTDGATSLTALAEYGGEKVRRSVNLEKAYLQGRFGAVPELDQSLLREALHAEVEPT